MLTQNLRTGSLEDAVTKTFDGQHPCCLCKQIAAGKKSESEDRILLFAEEAGVCFGKNRHHFDATVAI